MMYPAIISRPSEKLVTHCEQVGKRIVRQDCKSDSIGYWIGRLHDIGKATPFFQRYIDAELYETHSYTDGNLKNHSKFGAFTTVIALQESDTIEASERDLLIAFISILNHHSQIENVSETLELLATNDAVLSQLTTQFNAILENPHSKHVFTKLLPPDVTAEDIDHWYTESVLYKLVQKLINIEQTETEVYGELTKYFGLLTFADKSSVVNLSNETLYTDRLDGTEIDTYISNTIQPPEGKPFDSVTTEFDYIREQARQEARSTIKNTNIEHNHLFKLQLPTGFGKTFTALDTALQIYKQKQNANIVYALPLTSIIDQVSEDIQSVFNYKPSSPALTEHHYRATTQSDLNTPTQEFDTEPYTSTIHAESWQSDITLTTFVQLLKSLKSPTNKQSLKLAGLQNSILIIDEIQLLPVKWWGLITKLFETLIQDYNCHIISITATHPYIYNRQQTYFNQLQPTEILDPDLYYNFLSENNRLTFTLDTSAKNYIEPDTKPTPRTPENIASHITQNTPSSTAVILNKISLATQTTKQLEQKIPHAHNLNEYTLNNINSIHSQPTEKSIQQLKTTLSNNQPIIANLTANLLPIHRKTILKLLKPLLKSNQYTIYLISTQVLEAGVDISLNHIYRDIAPPSSIIQTAGRCNRNYNNTNGTLTLIHAIDPETETTSETIYNNTINRLTYLKSLFNAQNSTETQIIHHGMKNYYNTLFNSLEKENNIIGNQQYIKHYQNNNAKTLRKTHILDTQQSIQLTIPLLQNTKQSIKPTHNNEYYHIQAQNPNQTISIPLYKLQKSNNTTKLHKLLQNTFNNNQNIENTSELTAIYHQPINTIYTKYGINTQKLHSNPTQNQII